MTECLSNWTRRKYNKFLKNSAQFKTFSTETTTLNTCRVKYLKGTCMVDKHVPNIEFNNANGTIVKHFFCHQLQEQNPLMKTNCTL